MEEVGYVLFEGHPSGLPPPLSPHPFPTALQANTHADLLLKAKPSPPGLFLEPTLGPPPTSFRTPPFKLADDECLLRAIDRERR